MTSGARPYNEPQTWYVTFGYDHAYPNGYVVLEGLSGDAARERMHELFGREWAFQYDEATWHEGGVSQADRYGLAEVGLREIVWTHRARGLLTQALAELDEDDVIPTVTAALAALRIAVGELPEDELEGYPFPGEPPDESGCTCSPEQRARGGFRGGCPAHSLTRGSA